MSEPAELLPEPFTLLAGPAAPYVRLGAGAPESDEIRLDVELDAKPDAEPRRGYPAVSRVAPPVRQRVPSPADPQADVSAEPQADVSAEPQAEPSAEPASAAVAPSAAEPGDAAEPTSAAAHVSPSVAAGSPSAAAHPRPTARMVSGRGVTGRGIVVLILVVTGAVGLIEVAVAGHRGHAFGIAFVVSSAIGALVVRRRDLPTALIAPPLLYCVLIVAISVIDRHDDAGGVLTREGVYLGNAFVTGAPALWAGTAAAALIAWYRRHAARRESRAS